jgi:hypothetical protein
MKKQLLFTAFILAAFFCNAQQNDTTEKTFQMGIGVGA